MSDRSNRNDTKGMLIQYMQVISDYLRGRNGSKKVVTLAVAVLVLTGLLGVHYHNEGSLLPTSSTSGGKELPIYCVQTDEPKIALTFDAAWVEVTLLERSKALKTLEKSRYLDRKYNRKVRLNILL